MSKDSQMRAAINQKLIEMGERERLKELLRAKLVECGWKDQLKAHCKDVIREKGLEHVTVEDLVTEVTPKGRGTVQMFKRNSRGRKTVRSDEHTHLHRWFRCTCQFIYLALHIIFNTSLCMLTNKLLML
uniref:Transcription and mRNA export factor ENY2 n=1 Tax=Astatotilapia calliptera TaxID=8154 RepID=A0AAX7VQX9_ASTCA